MRGSKLDGPVRTSTITVAGHPFTVTQDAVSVHVLYPTLPSGARCPRSSGCTLRTVNGSANHREAEDPSSAEKRVGLRIEMAEFKPQFFSWRKPASVTHSIAPIMAITVAL
jgi:hypothetical protein